METNETRKGKYIKIILKEKKLPNKEQKVRKNKTYNNEEKPYLKKNEVCLLSPKFKQDKSLLKKLKHEPNIVEITHLCIRHGVHTSL